MSTSGLLELILKEDNHIYCKDCQFLEQQFPAYMFCKKFHVRLWDNVCEKNYYCGKGVKRE